MPRRSPFAVIALLALSHLATIALFLAGLLLFGFDATNFFAIVLVPIGTVLFGMSGSLGAIPGARIAQYPPEAPLRNLIMVAAATSFAVYLLLVAALVSWADPAHPGLLATLAALETHGDFRLTRGAHEIGNLGQVGSWGYLLLALKFAGAVLGGLAVHGALRLLPYCSDCRVFTRTREKGTLHFRSFEDWAAEMHRLPAEPWLRARHMLHLPRQKTFYRLAKHHVQVRLRRHECPRCLEQHMRERVFVHNGSSPVEQKQLSSVYSWMPSQAQSQPRPVQQAPAVRGFGRKVA